jgi:hypothetical protein
MTDTSIAKITVISKSQSWLYFIYITLGFFLLSISTIFFYSVDEIRNNWAQYRCNPTYWVFSENISEDFTYCVQNIQSDMMSYLLQPLNYMVTMLSSIGLNFSDAINNIREVFSSVRNFVSELIQNVFGVFLNILTEFQKMTISIKDMMGKIIGIVVTIMYVLDGSIKTMKSAWAGPPGQLVQAIGSCFHPETRIRLKNGEIYMMKDLPLGAELEDGARIFSVMKIANLDNEPLYKIPNGVNGDNIYVTGSHFIFDYKNNRWTQSKYFSEALLENKVKSDWFSCLITTNRQIKIGDQLFWDWEDDELVNKNK